jgi:hypothetical protein
MPPGAARLVGIDLPVREFYGIGATLLRASFFLVNVLSIAGRCRVTLELTLHPVDGVKLQAGNHLVATFEVRATFACCRCYQLRLTVIQCLESRRRIIAICRQTHNFRQGRRN